MREWEFNNTVARQLLDMLQKQGIACIYLNPEDQDISLQQRVHRELEIWRAAGDAKVSTLLLSIHANAAGMGEDFNPANGVETLFMSKTGRIFAGAIQKHLVEATGLTDRSRESHHDIATYYDLFMLRKTASVSALVECGFMTNFSEALKLRTPEFRSTVAGALCRGIVEFIESRQPAA